MSPLTSRLYAGSTDLQAMIAFLQTLRASGQKVYPIATDLYEELADPEVQVTARLWENGAGELAGFAYINRYQNLVDVFDERQFTPDLEAGMMAWLTAAARHRQGQTGAAQTLDASALESDLRRQAFLERQGFQRQAESSLLMSRPLAEPLPGPALPPGFTIRPMGGETELEAYVALHRAAFGTENMSVEYRRAIMNAPDYLPNLDLVAVAPGGELAAFCVCQIFPDDAPRAGGHKEGWTDPLGTHPAYQRRGLAQALIAQGMHLLKKRGIDTVLLGTSSENLAMQSTAASLGFQLVSNTFWYCKPV